MTVFSIFMCQSFIPFLINENGNRTASFRNISKYKQNHFVWILLYYRAPGPEVGGTNKTITLSLSFSPFITTIRLMFVQCSSWWFPIWYSMFSIRNEGSVVGNYRCQSCLTFSIESWMLSRDIEMCQNKDNYTGWLDGWREQ